MVFGTSEKRNLILPIYSYVFRAKSYPFGWEPDEEGFRGYVFATPDNSTIVVSIKGTSTGWFGNGGPTSEKDKKNDNLLFRYGEIHTHVIRGLRLTVATAAVVHMLTGDGHLFAIVRVAVGRCVLHDYSHKYITQYLHPVRPGLPGGESHRGEPLLPGRNR
jgi:hypothetical protein